jgi:hypothetical protein
MPAWDNCLLGIGHGKEAVMAETFQEWRQGEIEGLFLIAADTNQQQPQAEEMAPAARRLHCRRQVHDPHRNL